MTWGSEDVYYLELIVCKLTPMGSQQLLVLLAFGMKTPISQRKGERFIYFFVMLKSLLRGPQ